MACRLMLGMNLEVAGRSGKNTELIGTHSNSPQSYHKPCQTLYIPFVKSAYKICQGPHREHQRSLVLSLVVLHSFSVTSTKNGFNEYELVSIYEFEGSCPHVHHLDLKGQQNTKS